MTLRQKLLALLALTAVVPVLVSGALAYRQAEQALRGAISELHSRTAAAEAEHAARYVESLGAELGGALLYKDPATLGPAEVQEFLTRVFLSKHRISIAALIDAENKVTASIFVDDPEAFARQEPQFRLHEAVTAEESADFHARVCALLATFASTLEGSRPLVSVPYLTLARRRPALAVVIPAPHHRSHSLGVEVQLGELGERLATHYAGETRAFILDADRALLLHADRSKAATRQSYAAVFPRTGGASGAIEFEEAGVPYLAGYSPVRQLGWTAVVARPRASALAPLQALRWATAAVLALTLLAAATLAYLAARTFARPIAELTQGALELARGHLSYRIPLRRSDELGALARTFNEMGQSLEEANHQLTRFNEVLRTQVEERTRELRQAQEQLLRSQRLAAVGDMAAGVAHELNNPLAAIVGNAQLLLGELKAQDKSHSMLSDMLSSALRISDTVRGLLALSDSERAGRSRVNLHAVIERALSATSAELQSSAITVERCFDASLPKVLGDANALCEVVGHLLANSRTALLGRPQRTLTVATAVIDGQAVRVSVADTGCGIAPEHLQRIFNPFFTTKKDWTGKGLALSICHRIVENHQGRISIESQEGVGTTVSILLPAAPPPPQLM